MSTGAGDHNISAYQDKKRIDATMNQEEKIDGREWRILERWFHMTNLKNFGKKCPRSVH